VEFRAWHRLLVALVLASERRNRSDRGATLAESLGAPAETAELPSAPLPEPRSLVRHRTAARRGRLAAECLAIAAKLASRFTPRNGCCRSRHGSSSRPPTARC
jgi:hypothetical protein